MSYQKGFLHRKVVLFSGYFWVFLSKLMQTLFWVFTKIFVRYYSSKAMNSASSSDSSLESHQTKPKTEAAQGFSKSFEEDTELKSEDFGLDSDSDTLSHQSNQIDCNSSQLEAESMKECSDSEVVDDNGNFGSEEEEETSKLVFKFQYQNWNCNFNDEEESKECYDESCDFVKKETASTSTNKYQFFSGYSFSHFLDEPKASNFTVKELYVHPNVDDSPFENRIHDNSTEKVYKEEVSQRASLGATVRLLPHRDLEVMDSKPVACEDKTVSIIPPQTPLDGSLVHSAALAEDNLLSEGDDDFICSSINDSDSIGSIGEGFLSETDFGATIELDTLGKKHDDEENGNLTDEDLDFEDVDIGYEPDDFAEEDEDIMGELRKIEEDCGVAEKDKSLGNSSKPEEPVKHNCESLTAFDGDDSNRFDTLWEHQDLIEQLKMELKKVRATGLPTILEDSESPRITEDLKPWNIDEKFQHHGGAAATNELPKFYRSYRERMRKFDILNYQKMYAIGFLQSKDPLQSFSALKKPSSILQHGLSLYRRKKSIINISEAAEQPMRKFTRELYCDLETVYVGQLCLSWEFLHWEYEKALELWDTDQYGMRRFNEVAGEFQQFQVLLQRFIENEAFQGPRVENYNRNRCAMRSLLQVPVIREDNGKDRKKVMRQSEGDEDGITSDMLVEILEESIRTIWRFIRADKDASSFTRETQVELQDPADSELLLEIRTDLVKKEKRLRDLLRSGNCILKKLKKHDEDGNDQVLYFFSQVDMKLVWRVLNMSRITTDQLAWCRSKLNNITFVNRRIHVEPSFLLFPS